MHVSSPSCRSCDSPRSRTRRSGFPRCGPGRRLLHKPDPAGPSVAPTSVEVELRAADWRASRHRDLSDPGPGNLRRLHAGRRGRALRRRDDPGRTGARPEPHDHGARVGRARDGGPEGSLRISTGAIGEAPGGRRASPTAVAVGIAIGASVAALDRSGLRSTNTRCRRREALCTSAATT